MKYLFYSDWLCLKCVTLSLAALETKPISIVLQINTLKQKIPIKFKTNYFWDIRILFIIHLYYENMNKIQNKCFETISCFNRNIRFRMKSIAYM